MYWSFKSASGSFVFTTIVITIVCAIQYSTLHYSLFNEGDVINPMNYPTYGLHYTNKGQPQQRELYALPFTNCVLAL